nr:DUF3095 domain-containing protein [uncultured Shimia sp.]
MISETSDFYDTIQPVDDFRRLSDVSAYTALPDDWVVGTADIVGSTKEIAAGRYKTVNMIGAAVISAQVNAAAHRSFPYVFGGDGAGFAVWPEQRAAAERALLAVQRWAREEFDIELRAATTTVAEIRAAGQNVRVARHRASSGVDYGMFSGGGMAWAESEMKSGNLRLRETESVERPDLTGLSCRWSNMPARNGIVLSLVMKAGQDASETAVASVASDIISVVDGLERSGHPVPINGPGFRFPPEGIGLEARVSRAGRSLWRQQAALFVQNAFIWAIFTIGRRLGKFEPLHYRQMTARNADFRKFDDGLKMTLDCDPVTRDKIRSRLEQAQADGVIRYGLHEQDEAMMTCFVPSPSEDTHVHFVDGAAGGYAHAAAQIV